MRIGIYDPAVLLRSKSHLQDNLKALEGEAMRQGIHLFYFCDEDVDQDNDVVNEHVYSCEGIQVRQGSLPDLILNYIPTPDEKRTETEAYLRARVSFLADLIGAPLNLAAQLEKDELVKDYLVDYLELESFDQLMNFIKKHNKVIISPLLGTQSVDTFVFRLKEEEVILTQYAHEEKMGLEEFKGLIDDLLEENYWMVQEYRDSRTVSGRPLKLRVFMQKGPKGKWVLERGRVRIARKSLDLVSNFFALNNVYGDANVYLFLAYEEDYQEMLNKVSEAAYRLVEAIENTAEGSLFQLGLDLGIDNEGNVFFMEAIVAPENKKIKWETVAHTIEYFKYALEEQDE